MLWSFLLVVISYCSFPTEAKTVSQCSDGVNSFSFVSLYCGFKKVIQIQRAFHASHKNSIIDHCGYLEGDCTMDVIHEYDWGACEGKHSCIQMIRPRTMEPCPEQDMAYLQVHYACVPGTAYIPPKTTPSATPLSPTDVESTEELPTLVAPFARTPSNQLEETSSAASIVTTTNGDEPGHSICVNKTLETESATIQSPGYPDFYRTDTECRCVVKGTAGSKVAVTYQDLSVMMRGGQCVDWLLLQSLGYKNSAAVTCGQMTGKEKTLMAKGNWLLMHFHSAKGGRVTGTTRNMMGFKVKVETQPPGPFEIQCYPTPPEVLQTLKYKDSQLDINNNTLVPPTIDLNSQGQGSISATLKASHFTTLSLASGIFFATLNYF